MYEENMRQRFQIILGMQKPPEDPLARAREILGDLRSGVVIEAKCSNLSLYATFDRQASELPGERLLTAEDVRKWGVEIVLMNPIHRSTRLIGVRELERRYTASERVNEILAPVEARLTLEKALKT